VVGALAPAAWLERKPMKKAIFTCRQATTVVLDKSTRIRFENGFFRTADEALAKKVRGSGLFATGKVKEITKDPLDVARKQVATEERVAVLEAELKKATAPRRRGRPRKADSAPEPRPEVGVGAKAGAPDAPAVAAE